MAVIVQLRRGHAEEWSSHNPTLAPGEMGVELDTGKFKVGNGADDWSALPYSSGEDGATWLQGTQSPTESDGAEGDFFLQAGSGDVYRKEAGAWVSLLNLMGPEGAAGPAGPKGEPGPTGMAGPAGAGAIHSLQNATNVVGDVVLEFGKNQTQIVKQGGGALTYEFASAVPKNILLWDRTIWNIQQGEFPRLQWEVE